MLTTTITDPNSIRMYNRLDKECELFQQFYQDMLKKNLPYTIMEDVFDADGNKLWGVDFGGVYITSNVSFTTFEVGHDTYTQGSNYLDPEDDCDYSEYSKHSCYQRALFDVMKLMMEFEYKNFLESQWAEECVAELEDIKENGYEL
jgi:hypothetical protein